VIVWVNVCKLISPRIVRYGHIATALKRITWGLVLKNNLSRWLVQALLALTFLLPAIVAAGIDPGPDFSMEVPEGGALANERPRIFITTDPMLFESPDEFDDTYSNAYPSANYLRSITKDSGDDGVNLLIQAAQANSDRPLYVLSWGTPTTLADALKAAPDIASKIRIIMIGDSNIAVPRGPRDSFAYLYSQRQNLWWVLMDNSFTGVYIDSAGLYASLPVEESFSTFGFPEAYAKGHGYLGELFYSGINWSASAIAFNGRPQFRSGDLPSLLYLLRGNPDTPESEHWGGRFEKVTLAHGATYNGGAANLWVDVIDPQERLWPNVIAINPWEERIAHDAQRTVLRYQMQFMPEIASRYDRAKYPRGTNPEPIDPLRYTNGVSDQSRETETPPPAPGPIVTEQTGYTLFTVSDNASGWLVNHRSNTRQWVGPECRSQLQRAGAPLVQSIWQEIEPIEKTIDWQTCESLVTVIAEQYRGEATNSKLGLFAYENDQPYGYVVDAFSGNWQWVSAECRGKLETRGIEILARHWSYLRTLPQTDDWKTCDVLLAQLPFSEVAQDLTPARE